MPTQRLLEVQPEGPLAAIRQMLASLWIGASLRGMVIPVWSESGRAMRSTLLTSPDGLADADPFAPIMPMNAAAEAVLALRQAHSDGLALVLRPCELRSLRELCRRDGMFLSGHLLVSTDCLAVLPLDDFGWRREQALIRDQITIDALHFAAQGGILSSRLRPSCQLCEEPFPEEVDLHIQVFGLETSRHVVVAYTDPKLGVHIGFTDPGSHSLPHEITERRERVIERLVSWRRQAKAYAESHLSPEVRSIDGLSAHLESCDACRRRLANYCPLFESAWESRSDRGRQAEVEAWLVACGGCGMCEYTCPSGYPLFTVIGYLNHRLADSLH
jgi:Pyruvate/2-oxoacid:ferredoxin oxidoreductase delta subunit